MLEIIRERRIERGVSYDLCFDWLITLPNGSKRRTDGGFAFSCDEHGNVDMDELNKPHKDAALENYRLCASGQMRDSQGNTVSQGYVRRMPWSHVIPAAAKCDRCGGEAEHHSHCGCYVCFTCDNHLGLARCYCGWSACGGDGYQELVEMGEQINDDY